MTEYTGVMLISTAHKLVGTRNFTAIIVESVYNGEYSQNDTAESSSRFSSGAEAQEWALRALDTFKPLLRTRDNGTETPDEVEFWIELSEWEWVEITSPGVLDAEEIEVTRQYGYPDENGVVEWTDPEKP
jgi:hypothetical protein